MPIYDYKCKDCGLELEVQHGMTEKGPDICPECRGRLSKLVSRAGLQFRGSGFYITDYKNKPQETSGKKESKSEPISSTNE